LDPGGHRRNRPGQRTGSAAWASYVVDGDLAYEIDSREIPPDWQTGIVPYDRATPYQPPVPAKQPGGPDQLFHLNEGLTSWACGLTADMHLPDDANLKAVRAGYPAYPNAQKPPFVLKGDTITADRFWLGAGMVAWSEKWVRTTNGNDPRKDLRPILGTE
jgi:purine nucleoside permease